MNVSFASPAWMISRATVFASAMSRADVEPEPGVGPLRRACPPRIDDVQRRAAMDGLEDVVEEDRMRLAGVRAPQDQQIRFLDLSIGRRPAARTEHRRQTDDARSVSSAVARVDVVRPHHRTHELLSQEVDLVRRLRAAEHAERARRVLRPGTGKTRCREIERLIPARGAKRPVLAHQRLSQPATVLYATNHLLPSIQARGRCTNVC